jgi:hypothetical protein
MHFLKTVASVALFAAAALAQGVAFTSTPSGVQVGQSYTITWTGGDPNQPVTLVLRSGSPGNLDTTTTITADAKGGSYTWTPGTTIPDGAAYALQITQGTDTNYSGQFTIQGGTAAVASVSQASIISSQVASASSAASSQAASASAAASSASASQASVLASQTGSSSSSASSTKSTASSTKSTTSTSASSSPTAATSNSGNAIAPNYQSPLALIFGAVAAMAYFQ